MDRQIVYPGQILPETTLLQMAKDAMIGSAKLAAAMLGTSTIANGFAVTPTGPASLQIVVAPGEIYAIANIDSLAFSTLPADTTHSILKQGIMLDGVTLSCPAPTTTGQSINYLVQVAYQDQDSTPALLPYYNSANPALPYSGMGNNGLTQNTSRKGVAIVQVKAGASAATGSQVTPAPDSGYVGLFVATVAYGQTTITSGNITQYAGAPLLPSGVLQSIQGGNTTYALDTGAVNACAATFFPAITALVDGLTLRFKAANSNTGAATFSPNGISAAPIVGGNHAALQGGEIAATGDVWVQWNSSIGSGSWVLVESSGGGLQVAAATKSQHATNAAQAQAQSVTAFASGGVSTALTLTPIPAITAYAANQRFRVKFSQASTGADTINVSGLGVKSIKQYDSTGAKVAAVFAVNQLADVEYDGTDWVLLDPLPPASSGGIQGAFKKLSVSTTGLSDVVSVSADALGVESSTNAYQILRGVSVYPTFANAGANGLDVGAANSQTAPTWYSVWVIWNGVAAAGLLSLSAVAPTLPAGYTHKARVGWVRTDASANKFPLAFIQAGRKVQYTPKPASNTLSWPLMSSGAAVGNITSGGGLVAVGTSGVTPITASEITMTFTSTAANSSALLCPSNNFGGEASASSLPLGQEVITNGSQPPFKMMLETPNVYMAVNTSFLLNCVGYEDNL